MLLIDLPEWVNYPGLELWKFADLAIFLAAGIFILRKPLKSALATRRESIKREIVLAQEEREQAAAKLAEAQAMLARLDSEIAGVQAQARQEAALERQRLAKAADNEIEKLKAQANREMEIARKAAQKELRRFLANRSLELARESVANQLRPEDDNRLIKDRIEELRRARG